MQLRFYLIFALYSLIALAFGIWGDTVFTLSISPWIIAGFIFIAAALLHESFLRQRDFQHIELGFEALSNVLSEVAQQAEEQKSALEELQRRIKNQYVEKQTFEDVQTELTMLQSLVTQLSGRVGGPAVTKKPAKIAAAPKSRETLLESVRDALRCDRVDLYLQPIVSLPQRRTRFYECFSRIRNRKGELILPEHYIEEAEKEGLIAAIDNMLLFRCVQLIRKIRRQHAHHGFFINLSPHTLHDEHFFGDFIEFLRENPDLAQNLTFEVDQTEFDNRGELTERLLAELRQAGCQLCLQKVTTLSFRPAELKEAGFTLVKIEIDMLMPHIGTKNPAVDVNAMIMNLSRYGVELIVEKIEKEKPLIELLDFNVDYGQGFLFGEPFLSSEGVESDS